MGEAEKREPSFSSCMHTNSLLDMTAPSGREEDKGPTLCQTGNQVARKIYRKLFMFSETYHETKH